MPVSVANLIAIWFGCGRSPYAPGTAGSAAAVAIAIALQRWLGFGPTLVNRKD